MSLPVVYCEYMENDIFDDMAIERLAKQKFGMSLDIDSVIVRGVPVGRSATATVFLTTKKQLLVYIDGQIRLLLSDVKKIVSRMGLVAELYIPPKGQPTYFDDIGKEKFRAVFPGRNNPSSEDIIYYRTLAPYQPALVQILEVKDGTIYQYDTDAKDGWRPATKFAYRRIRTS